MAPFINSIGSVFALLLLTISSASSFASLTTASPPSTNNYVLYTDTANAKKLLHEDSWMSNMSPDAAREYLTNRSTWLFITPDCEKGSITVEKDKEFDDAWSITSESGSHILVRNTIIDKGSGYLSYNVVVTTPENAQFTFDIEYELSNDGMIRRIVYDIETIGMKSKMMKPFIRSPLTAMIKEENEKLKVSMSA